MEDQTLRIIARIFSYIGAGVLFAAAAVVGLIPRSEGGISAVCPSALQNLFQGPSFGQSLMNVLSGGGCTAYTTTMTNIMVVLLVLALIALILGILLRRRRGNAQVAGYPYPPTWYQGQNGVMPPPGFGQQQHQRPPEFRGQAGFLVQPPAPPLIRPGLAPTVHPAPADEPHTDETHL